jgi:hypothetical protein
LLKSGSSVERALNSHEISTKIPDYGKVFSHFNNYFMKNQHLRMTKWRFIWNKNCGLRNFNYFSTIKVLKQVPSIKNAKIFFHFFIFWSLGGLLDSFFLLGNDILCYIIKLIHSKKIIITNFSSSMFNFIY